MRGQWFRLKTSTPAIRFHNDQKCLTSIPAGSEIVVAGPLDGDRLLDVEWEGNAVRMFSTDIQEYGEPLEANNR